MKEPELAGQMAKSAGSIQNTSVYCASCAGNLTRAGGKNIKTSAGTDPWKRRSAGCKAFSVEPGSCRKIEEGESMKKNKINGSKR